MSPQKGLHPVGQTPEGLVVVSGVFPLVDTHGIPLDTVVEVLKSRSYIPDWLDFFDQAVRAGWKPSRVITRLAEAVRDVYGSEFSQEWERRFRGVLDVRKREG